MSKNQPRDGNGKFAKTIKVVDKYGNSAYFTPEELEGFGKKKEDKNPDCDPATKGYVKCQIRKLISVSGHSHEYKNDLGGAIGTVSLVSGFFSFIFGMFLSFPTVQLSELSNAEYLQSQEIGHCVLTFSAVMWVIFAAVFISTHHDYTENNTITDEENDVIPEFQKYEPPCEKKDNCS